MEDTLESLQKRYEKKEKYIKKLESRIPKNVYSIATVEMEHEMYEHCLELKDIKIKMLEIENYSLKNAHKDRENN